MTIILDCFWVPKGVPKDSWFGPKWAIHTYGLPSPAIFIYACRIRVFLSVLQKG